MSRMRGPVRTVHVQRMSRASCFVSSCVVRRAPCATTDTDRHDLTSLSRSAGPSRTGRHEGRAGRTRLQGREGRPRPAGNGWHPGTGGSKGRQRLQRRTRSGGQARPQGGQGRQGGPGRARPRRALPPRSRRPAAARLRLEAQQGVGAGAAAGGGGRRGARQRGGRGGGGGGGGRVRRARGPPRPPPLRRLQRQRAPRPSSRLAPSTSTLPSSPSTRRSTLHPPLGDHSPERD